MVTWLLLAVAEQVILAANLWCSLLEDHMSLYWYLVVVPV